jgi:hypothetical protein
VINAVVLISGQRAVVTAVRKTQYLKVGDPFVEFVNTMHYSINRGKIPAELVFFYGGVIYGGVINTPITVVEKEW